MDEDWWIGRRVSAFRAMTDLSQQALADRVPISRSYLSLIENGHRAVTSRALLIKLAEALKVAPEQLTAVPERSRSTFERSIAAVVPDIRAALDGALDVPALPVPQLHQQVDDLMRARMDCDYPLLARRLPDTLARTLALAHVDATGYELAARATFTASMVLRPLSGMLDLSTRLAERTQWAAAYAANPAAVAAGEFARAQCALAGGVGGLRQRSLDLAVRAADDLTGYENGGALAWRGLLHLAASLAAGSLGHTEDALAHIGEATRIAERHDGDDGWFMEFTRANIWVWEVAALVEDGEPGRAVAAARRVSTRQLRSRQRQAHLLIHTGRAMYGAEQPGKAVEAFLRADGIAPAEVRGRTTVREIVGQQLRDVRRVAGSEALRDLAVRVNVDPLHLSDQ